MLPTFYLTIISTSALVILFAVWLFFFLNTDRFLKFGLGLYRVYAGMQVNYVPRKNGKGVWCYAEKGSSGKHSHHHHKHHHNKHPHKRHNNPTLVFLHGFGSDKDMWPSVLTSISSSYHSVIVDMPGHGETTFVDGIDEPNVESFVRSVREFLEVTNLDKRKIILVGCSFGGAVAALFAHYYPECIEKLALLCPAIRTPILTNTCARLMNGDHEFLIPENGKQFTKMISTLCNKTQYYPHRIMQSYVNINFTPERQTLLKKILKNLVSTDMEMFERELKHKIGTIKLPTLIIWGEDDEMLHVSGGKLLADSIENSHLRIIKNCNHALQLDQPKKTAKLLLEFIKATSFATS